MLAGGRIAVHRDRAAAAGETDIRSGRRGFRHRNGSGTRFCCHIAVRRRDAAAEGNISCLRLCTHMLAGRCITGHFDLAVTAGEADIRSGRRGSGYRNGSGICLCCHIAGCRRDTAAEGNISCFRLCGHILICRRITGDGDRAFACKSDISAGI